MIQCHPSWDGILHLYQLQAWEWVKVADRSFLSVIRVLLEQRVLPSHHEILADLDRISHVERNAISLSAG